MVASLLRVLHSGPQDGRLLPPLTKDGVKAYVRVLVRAGRMTTQWQRLDFYNPPNFGQQATVQIPVKGELLTRLYLVTTMPDIWTPQAAARKAVGPQSVVPSFGWTNSLGHALIANAQLDIGGARAEVLDGRLLEVLDEFNTPLEKVLLKNSLLCRKQNGFSSESFGHSTTPTKVITPLPFWFSRGDLGAALPIDALYVDSVTIKLQFQPVTSVYYTETRSATPTNADGSALWPILGSKFYYLSTNSQPIPGITMPLSLSLGDTYLMAEYVYLDKPEANRFRIAEITIPVVQHYPIEPTDTRGFPRIQIPIDFSNPIRNLFFMAQNYNANTFNAPFLATRDLSGCDILEAPWWPDCSGLLPNIPGALIPGFAMRGSEPFSYIELLYEGKYVKTSTENCAIYRSILPSLEMRKSPWHNRYMYVIPFGVQSGYTNGSTPSGQTNLNRITNKDLILGINPNLGTDSQYTRLWIYAWVEMYNVFRIYGGRGTLLFAY